MLRFENVCFQYEKEDFQIIDNLTFHVNQGEFVCIIGTSGCGKSTIFRLINKLLRVKSGRILVDGEDIGSQQKYCGYMPQYDLLFPWRTVADNVALPLEISRVSKGEISSRVEGVLKKVGLWEYSGKFPRELSGGMKQRVAFARTIMTECDLLLLDEPFCALDYMTRLYMQEWLLEQWEKDKKTVVFITHDVEEALFLANRVLVVDKSPISSLSSVEVSCGYPRHRDMLARPEIVELKTELIDRLSCAVKSHS